MKWINIGVSKDIPEGVAIHVEVDGTQIAVFNLAGEFYAIEDMCTHDGGQLSGGCVENDVIICPRHGARFSIKTGEALSAPAYEPTNIFPIRVENGMVLIGDEAINE